MYLNNGGLGALDISFKKLIKKAVKPFEKAAKIGIKIGPGAVMLRQSKGLQKLIPIGGTFGKVVSQVTAAAEKRESKVLQEIAKQPERIATTAIVAAKMGVAVSTLPNKGSREYLFKGGGAETEFRQGGGIGSDARKALEKYGMAVASIVANFIPVVGQVVSIAIAAAWTARNLYIKKKLFKEAEAAWNQELMTSYKLYLAEAQKAGITPISEQEFRDYINSGMEQIPVGPDNPPIDGSYDPNLYTTQSIPQGYAVPSDVPVIAESPMQTQSGLPGWVKVGLILIPFL